MPDPQPTTDDQPAPERHVGNRLLARASARALEKLVPLKILPDICRLACGRFVTLSGIKFDPEVELHLSAAVELAFETINLLSDKGSLELAVIHFQSAEALIDQAKLLSGAETGPKQPLTVADLEKIAANCWTECEIMDGRVPSRGKAVLRKLLQRDVPLLIDEIKRLKDDVNQQLAANTVLHEQNIDLVNLVAETDCMRPGIWEEAREFAAKMPYRPCEEAYAIWSRMESKPRKGIDYLDALIKERDEARAEVARLRNIMDKVRTLAGTGQVTEAIEALDRALMEPKGEDDD